MSIQVSVGSEGTAFATSNAAQSSSLVAPMSVKNLAPNEFLFQVGEPRDCLYRVESGSLAIYEPRLNGSHAVIDFAFPGDLVGLGFLKNQTHTARAMVETQVACLPIASMDSLVAGNPKTEAKLAQTIEREIELRKTSLVEAGRHNPVERVAAFLVTLSQVNRREGQDPRVLADRWQCGAVADQLELSIDELTDILLDLEKLGLIEACPVQGPMQVLCIKDHDKLAEIADRLCCPGIADDNAVDEARPVSCVSSSENPGQAISDAA